MGVFILIVIVAGIAGGVYWNHRNAARAFGGVSFVVAYPPSAVADAVQRAHNEGGVAAIRSFIGGVKIQPLGPTSFATGTSMGDSGEISISRDPAGSLVTARALDLYVGSHPKTHHLRFSAFTHGLYTLLGIRPNAAKVRRWQEGLERRINKSLARATS
jgi:hypothetical protein